MKQRLYLYFAWLLSCLAFAGSLYFSEIRGIKICDLCWYERIALFPLVWLLGVALYKNFSKIFVYAIAFPILAMIISGYHIALQEIPGFAPIQVCSRDVSCAIKQNIGLGFISLPMLAFVCSLLITLLLFLSKENSSTYSKKDA